MMANITPTRRDTRSKKTAFLEALSMHGTIIQAARVGGIHRDTHYYWLLKDPTYRERMQQAVAHSTFVRRKRPSVYRFAIGTYGRHRGHKGRS